MHHPRPRGARWCASLPRIWGERREGWPSPKGRVPSALPPRAVNHQTEVARCLVLFCSTVTDSLSNSRLRIRGERAVSLARVSPGFADIRAAADFCHSLSRGKTQEKPQTRCIAKASRCIKLLWKERKTLSWRRGVVFISHSAPNVLLRMSVIVYRSSYENTSSVFPRVDHTFSQFREKVWF